MGYYDDERTAREYIAMADGDDGRELIAILSKHVPDGSQVLELGMGPGKDLDILAKNYEVTGSDKSQVFVDLYRQEHPNADLLVLDAVTLDTGRKFDCIFSNKVLHHLNPDELRRSLQRQHLLLNDGGYVMHSFWKGEGSDEMSGLMSFYQSEERLISSFSGLYDIISIMTYDELDIGDSVYVIAQRSP